MFFLNSYVNPPGIFYKKIKYMYCLLGPKSNKNPLFVVKTIKLAKFKYSRQLDQNVKAILNKEKILL